MTGRLLQFIFCLLPAARAGAAAAAPPEAGPLTAGSLLQLFLYLVLVLALIAVLAWVMRRLGRFQNVAGGSLRILGGLSMGSRERLVLVQVGGTQLLLGVAPGRVQTLHVLEHPVSGEPPGAEGGTGFAERLSAALGRGRPQ